MKFRGRSENHMTRDTQPSRRNFFSNLASGLGGIALFDLLRPDACGRESAAHFAPKVKRIIQIFCPGGVSHIDTFDYKPDLARQDGQEMVGKGKIDTFFGQPGRLMKSPFRFGKYGKSGRWVSDLFPNLAGCVDDLTFIRSMTAKSANHTPAAFQMNSGFVMNGFPAMGSWISYGLGTENENLPSFVVLPDPRGLPAGGAINWSSGFLPATHQGVAFRPTGEPIADLETPNDTSPAERQAASKFLDGMNREFLDANPGDSNLSARIHSYELAARMQMTVPEAVRIDDETKSTRRLYGLDQQATAGFGRNCLLARRLLERGVRFVQLWHGGAFGSPRINWDAHEDIVDNHTTQAISLDKPLAGLLKDLKQRGLLDDTLVLWTTEFGRTPFTQGVGKPGRDHHQHAFTIFMAGGGIKPGIAYGASDEIGYNVVENEVTIYDFHATILHLLGIEHTKLTFYHNGIRRRLTDVHGQVVKGVLA
jgi:Protein of unknown function (DUF1501)